MIMAIITKCVVEFNISLSAVERLIKNTGSFDIWLTSPPASFLH